MSLLTYNWRLKLLAVALALLMLGAVTLAQNPPRTKQLSLRLSYIVETGFVLIDPPSQSDVAISGLADVIAAVTPDNIIADLDATRLSAPANTSGPWAVKLNVRVTAPAGVGVQSPAPIVVNVDTMESQALLVQVSARGAPGWSIDKATAACPATPCVVTFNGPASWQVNLSASVAYPALVNADSIQQPNELILLTNSDGSLEPSTKRTIPPSGLDITSASIQITAHPGSTSSTVPLVDAAPIKGPPPGYRVTGIAITPVSVTIVGDAVAIGRIQEIELPPQDLSGQMATVSFNVTIPYPPNVTGSVTTARITYFISPNPNVSPSP